MKKKILLIYTGGTIGMVKNDETNSLEPMDFDDLISSVPEIKQLGVGVDSYSFSNPIDSTDINLDHWVKISKAIEKRYDDYNGFVVLHGTDTMAYSASMMSFMLEGLEKPVIFTGSQLPVSHPRTDARENIITSMYFACDDNIKEVCLYFEFQLHRGNRTKKISSESFNAFTSPNYPALAQTGVSIKLNYQYLLKPLKGEINSNDNINDNVAIIRIFPGVSENYFRAVFNTKDLEGVIIESYGSGNIMSYSWVLDIMNEAINKKNIKIVNVSQCFLGEVRQGYYAVSSELEKIGVIGGRDITMESAITKMMFLLGQGVKDQREFKQKFLTPICGEIS